MVSGSSDGKIRLWSPTHLAKPWSVLVGHATSVAAVCLVVQDQSPFLWSLCEQSVRKESDPLGWPGINVVVLLLFDPQKELRYWDLSNQGKCLHTIRLEFGSSSSRRKGRVSFGQRPLLALGSVLYVACGDSIATVRLLDQQQQQQQQLQPPTSASSSIKSQRSSIVQHIRRSRDTLSNVEESEATLRDGQLGAESKIPLRFREGLLEFGYRHEDDVFDDFVVGLQKVFSGSVNSTQRLRAIDAEEDQDDGTDEEPAYEWEAEVFGRPPPPTHLVPINLMKLKELDGAESMKRHVKEGTPFCGLRVVEPKRIQLPRGLPVTDRMRRQGIKAFDNLDQIRTADFDLFAERLHSLSSQRSSIASSIISYYRQKNVGDRVVLAGDSGELGFQLRASSSSRTSSRSSSLSPHHYSSTSSAADAV